MRDHGGDFDHAAWLAYTTLVVVSIACGAYYWNRSLREPIHALGRNGFLLGACLVAVAIQALIPYVPVLAEAFHATPLDASEWLLVAMVAFAPALVACRARSQSGRRARCAGSRR